MARIAETLTLGRLREVLSFNPSEGIFRWRMRLAKNTIVGAVAGGRSGRFQYRYIRIDKKDYLAQRLAWFWVNGVWPRLIRFQNGSTDDLRIGNLCEGFYLDTKHDHRTKEGRAAYQKEYRAANPDRTKEQDLQKTFNIDMAEYTRKLVTQKGVCAICEQPETGTRKGKLLCLSVDHNHDTGAVRDLLCRSCNVMIGYAREDADILAKAVAYLRKHSSGDPADNVVRLVTKEAS